MQARNHRVRLRAATPASYDALATLSTAESIHLFPGELIHKQSDLLDVAMLYPFEQELAVGKYARDDHVRLFKHILHSMCIQSMQRHSKPDMAHRLRLCIFAALHTFALIRIFASCWWTVTFASLCSEGGMTNGRGMMAFSRGFMRFAQGMPVVPVALRADIPWGISTHTITSSFLSNMFWFCFPPVIRLEATVLPALQQQEVRDSKVWT